MFFEIVFIKNLRYEKFIIKIVLYLLALIWMLMTFFFYEDFP